jgi:hypothetical protein
MEHVIVERIYAEPVTVEQVRESVQRGESCRTMHRVRFLRMMLSRDGRRSICEYEAPDAESVRLVNERLGLPFERAWTTRVLSAEELARPAE